MQNGLVYGYAHLRDFRVHGVMRGTSGKVAVTGITVGEQLTIPTAPFWQSLCGRGGVSGDGDRHHDPYSMLQNIVAQRPDDVVCYLVHCDSDGNNWLMGIATPRWHGSYQSGFRNGLAETARNDVGHLFIGGEAVRPRPSLN